MLTARPLQRAKTTNATGTSFPSKVPTITEPTGDGVHVVKGERPCHLRVFPFGTGDANDVFDMRVIGWNRIHGSTPLWVPGIIASLTCTLGTTTGVAGTPVVATELFCDTITILSEPTITADTTRQGTVKTYSPTGDLIGWAVIELPECEKIEFTFDMTTNDPTGANCLFALL